MINATFETIKTHEVDGVAYELHRLPVDHRFAARIHIHDTDADEVVSNTFYPQMEKACKAYAALLSVATR